MAVAFDQALEIADHAARQPVLAVGIEAQQGEIAVPVIDFAKPPARHDIGLRQGQRRRSRRRRQRRTAQDRPQRRDMRLQAQPRRRRRARRWRRRIEMRRDERPERVRALRRLRAVGGHDGGGRLFRRHVDEGLAVGKDALRLHRPEQRAVEVRRSLDVRLDVRLDRRLDMALNFGADRRGGQTGQDGGQQKPFHHAATLRRLSAKTTAPARTSA